MGYIHSQDETREYCPFCEKETDVMIERLDSDMGKMCLECENDLLIPTVKGGEPFVFGNKVYTMHLGSDDELSIERFTQ